MKKLRWTAVLAIFALIPFALVACSSDDGSEDEDEITKAITRSATEADPASCTEDQTENFLRQTAGGGETGGDLVQRCKRDQAQEPVAESVEVSEVEIEGDSATAAVTFINSVVPYLDGQSVEIALVQEEDNWKLDQLVEFVEFSRQAFVDSVAQLPPEEGGGEETSACIEQELEAISDEELEGFLDNDETVFKNLEPCFEGQGGGAAQDEGAATEEEGTGTEEEGTGTEEDGTGAESEGTQTGAVGGTGAGAGY